MYNFKKSQGTFKGLAGEAMFRLVNKHAVLTHFIPKERILPYSKQLTEEQNNFLNQNWHSIDCVNVFEKIIYEIKTKNDNINLIKYPLKLTNYQTILFKKAEQLGFEVKVCILWLHTNWNFTIQEIDFKKVSFYREKPIKFDKAKYSKT